MSAWTHSPLIDLCDPDRGITYGIVKVGEFVPGGIPVVRGGDIRNNSIVFEDHKRVSEDVSNQYRRTILQGGELAINLISEAGHVAVVPEALAGANVSRDVGVIALRPEINSKFVCYYLKSPQCIEWLHSRLQGSVTQKINLSTLRDVAVPRPPKAIEDAIAGILSALDDKVELNRQRNETLEAMAQAIFRDWFVDFGPTRRKLAGIADPVEIMGSVTDPARAAELAALFPATLGDNGLPEGWEAKGIDALAEFLNGLALQKFPVTDGAWLPAIKIAQLRTGNTENSDRVSAHLPPQYVVNDGDVLFSWSGSLTHLIWTGGCGALNQHLFKVTSDNYPKWFYYLWLSEHMPTFQAVAASKATTMGHIQRHHLTQAVCAVPSRDVIENLGRTIAPLIDRLTASKLESRTLAAARDLLLPKLMSGEIRLRDAEPIAAGAL